MAGGIKGFKGSSSNLPKDVRSAARRNKRKGNQKSIVSPSGDSASPTGGTKVAPRRSAAFGGSDKSLLRAAIGGPFAGRSGNRKSKTAMVDTLPR